MIFQYIAFVQEVTDGDTVVVVIDQGLGNLRKETLRLNRINAPENETTTREAGLASTARLKELVEGKTVVLHTVKTKRGTEQREKYGRYLAELYINNININNQLVDEGHAVFKAY